MTLTPANFNIDPEAVCFVRIMAVSPRGNTSAAIRITIICEGTTIYNGYVSADEVFPIIYDAERGQYISPIELRGRTSITATNDGTTAATNLGVSVTVEIIPDKVRE